GAPPGLRTIAQDDRAPPRRRRFAAIRDPRSISRADVGRRGAAESVGALVRAAGAEVRWLRGSEESLEGDDRIGQVEAAVIVRVACIEAGGRHGGGARSEEPEERTDRVGDVDRRIAVAIASWEAASWIDDDAE